MRTPQRFCGRHTTRMALCSVCQRTQVEEDIAERTIKALFAAKKTVSVHNGEDLPIGPFAYDAAIGLQPSVDKVLNEMFQTDDEYLLTDTDAGKGTAEGWIRFIYGNDGWDVISDYTTNLESILAPVNAYADTLDPS